MTRAPAQSRCIWIRWVQHGWNDAEDLAAPLGDGLGGDGDGKAVDGHQDVAPGTGERGLEAASDHLVKGENPYFKSRWCIFDSFISLQSIYVLNSEISQWLSLQRDTLKVSIMRNLSILRLLIYCAKELNIFSLKTTNRWPARLTNC